jgi:hypothetical protein
MTTEPTAWLLRPLTAAIGTTRKFVVVQWLSAVTEGRADARLFLPDRQRLTSVTPIDRIASAIGAPCDVRTSTCRNFATTSSGLCFFAMVVLLDGNAILRVGPLHWGWIIAIKLRSHKSDPDSVSHNIR